MNKKEPKIIPPPKEYSGGKIVLSKPAMPVTESFCWRPDFAGENMKIVMWFRKMLPRNHRGKFLAPGTTFEAKTMTPEAACLFRTHRDFWVHLYGDSKSIPNWEEIFLNMRGGILAVRSLPESVISTLLNLDEKRNWNPLLLPGTHGPFSLFDNLNGFFPFAEEVSRQLKCIAVHLVYDDTSGLFLYTIHQKGKLIEKLEFLSEVSFESEISEPPINITQKNASSAKTFFKILNRRFKELNLLPPGFQNNALSPTLDKSASIPSTPSKKKKLSPLQQLRSLSEVKDEHVDLIGRVLSNVDYCYESTALQSLSTAAAREFARHNRWLILCLSELPDNVARELSKNGSTLDLRGSFSISAEAASYLASSEQPNLYLDGITSLSDAVAQNLSAYEGNLGLGGLTTISNRSAKALAAHKGGLDLSGLTSLSDDAAKALAFHDGDLNLSGLTTISDASAKALSALKSNLELRGLESLSDASAEALAKREGELELWGLKEISDSVAKALAAHKGNLSLRGLNSLSEAAAKSLAMHVGELDLSGLNEISESIATVLKTHKGKIELKDSR